MPLEVRFCALECVCVYVEEAVNEVPENGCDPLSRESNLKCVQCLDT